MPHDGLFAVACVQRIRKSISAAVARHFAVVVIGGFLSGQYGFAGSLCQVLDCPGQPDCTGRGTCVLSSVTNRPECACKSRYNGTECERLNSGANALVDLAAATPSISSIIGGSVVNVNITAEASRRSGFTVVGRVEKAGVKIREAYTLVFLVTSPLSLVRLALVQCASLRFVRSE